MSVPSVNPDLAKERLTTTFDVTELTYLVKRGEEETKRQRMLDQFMFDDANLRKFGDTDDHLSYEDVFTNSLRRAAAVMTKIRNNEDTVGDIESLLNKNDAHNVMKYWRQMSPWLKLSRELFLNYTGTVSFPSGSPIHIHYAMFIPALLGHCNEEQQATWLPKALDLSMIGCYAQTEIGHGTHVRGLETTATYDPSTEQFVIHSPSLTSIKWWPGSLGRASNYALVVARLITKGQNYGVHPFLVPIRGENDHKPLPGVEVGEIGPKMGANAFDNGYLRFNQFRIPRDHMLMKNAKVLSDGTYVRPPSDKLNYGTMVFIRVLVSRDAASKLASACTIAIRYSSVRRQSELVEGEPEPQVLDFQSQQYKLFPLLAAAYAFTFASTDIWDLYKAINSNVLAGNYDGMAELHALSSGLKAMTSDMAASGVEICRLACGGHGYLQSSGFPRIYGIATAAVTYEGENTVLLLQTARYLIKSYRDAQTGKPVQHSVAYLACDARSNAQGTDRILDIYKRATAGLIADAAARLQVANSKRNNAALAWNDCAIYLTKCAKFHSQCYIIESFHKALNNNNMSKPLREVLTQLFEMYALSWMREHSGDFLRFSSLTADELSAVETRIQNLLAQLRPNAVGLVDAFDFHDGRLNSVLGCYDGWAYERMYKHSKSLPTNQSTISASDHAILKEIQAKL